RSWAWAVILKVARVSAGNAKSRPASRTAPTTIERPPLASGTDRAGRGADDDLAGRRRDTADHLAGERIHGPTRDALQVHVDHVHGQAAARHTITGGDLLVQHDIADPGKALLGVGGDGRVPGRHRHAGHREVRERRAVGVAERTALA